MDQTRCGELATRGSDGKLPWRLSFGEIKGEHTDCRNLGDRYRIAPSLPASSIHLAYQSFYVRSVNDPPAGPCVKQDCARELRLPIHPTVCFKVGRFTLTQSSWTASTRGCSRKWMSGHAATPLVSLRDRGQFATLIYRPLGEPVPPSQGESPFPVDLCLSWMSCFLHNANVRPSPFRSVSRTDGTVAFSMK